MKSINKINSINSQRQKGAALLIAMVVLASVAVFYLMGQFGAVNQKLDRQDSRVAALAEAKTALIAYAVNYINKGNTGEYGFLPCPDFVTGGISPEGGSDACTGIPGDPNVSVLGRLPWRSLDLKPLRDDANECLWYAVSGPYKNGANKTTMLNDDINGLFEIYDAQDNRMYGDAPEDRIVAVILAPGVTLAGQNRGGVIPGITGTETCGGNYTVSNYLEGNGVRDNSAVSNTADSLSQFIKSGSNTAFNDRLAIITQGDIWRAVKRHKDFIVDIQGLTQSIASCVKEYGDLGTAHNLPWPSALDLDLPDPQVTDYRVDGNYIDANNPVSLLGRLPENVQNSETELANNGGGTVPTQDCQDCLDNCQLVFNKETQDALDEYNKELVEAQEDYDKCIAKGKKPPEACQTKYDTEVAKALKDYNKDLNDAQNDLDKCINKCLGKTFCSGYVPPGGGSTPKGELNLLSINACLSADQYKLWQNWKDHFFYTVSPEFAPDSDAVVCSGACVTTNGGASNHAAIVMFSGQRLTNQTRNDAIVPGDVDTKQVLTNYLENGNEVADGSFDASAGNAVNVNSPAYPTDFEADYLYCIDDGALNMTVNACP